MMNDELCRENNLNEDELEKVSGGNGYYYGNWKSVRANVVPGTFLALRSQACYDDGNIEKSAGQDQQIDLYENMNCPDSSVGRAED